VTDGSMTSQRSTVEMGHKMSVAKVGSPVTIDTFYSSGCNSFFP
jgi:hypothetical protein